MEHEAKATLKARVIEEFRLFWVIALYLALFLGAFTAYRRLVLAETGTAYLHYGIALIQALVIAKVVLLGRMFKIGRRFERGRLIVVVVYKTILFAGLVVAFYVVERSVEGWLHGKGLLGGLRDIEDIGLYEITARILVLVVAFVPVIAFGEIGRMIGLNRLASMFFSKPEAGRRPTT